MKLISLMVAFCFSMNVFASSANVEMLERHFDDYHYALSVEWDQKDEAFREQKTKEFFVQMENMMNKQELTQEEVVSVIEKKLNNKEALNAMKLKLALMGNASSPEQLSKLIKESSSDFYARGASWNGYVLIPVSIILTAAVALGFAMWYSATHGCTEYAQTCDVFGCRNNYDVCLEYGYTGPHL